MIVGQEKPSIEDSLVHFGVKGMKWGVRKDPDRGGGRSTETKAERKLAKKTMNDYLWDSIADEPMWRTMKKSDYDALSTEGETYAKNLILKRVEMDKASELRGATYVSKLEADSNFYRATIPSVGPSVKGLGAGGQKHYKQEAYEIEMKTIKKLSVPSEKERVDAFMELLSEPAIKLPGKKSPVTGREYLEKNGYGKLFKKQTDQELTFAAYHDFVQGQGNRSAPLNKPYFDKLKAKGYNALVDANDQGRFTKNPLILLDPETSVVKVSVRKLTTDEINQAQRKLGKRSNADVPIRR